MYIYHVKFFWLALFSPVVGKLATEVEALRERVWDMVGGESWERFDYTRDN